jgi:hypothetical protein
MKILHLINKPTPDSIYAKGLTKVKDEKNSYVSCCWDFDLEVAKTLIGGMWLTSYFLQGQAYHFQESFLGTSLILFMRVKRN